MREKITLTTSQLQDIVFDDTEEYEMIVSEITGTFRHGNENEGIIKRNLDGKFFKAFFRDSVKDGMDWSDMNHGPFEFEEVFKSEKTITVYI